MENRFELSTRGQEIPNPEKVVSWLENHFEKSRTALAELAITPEQDIIEWSQHLRELYQKELNESGNFSIVDVPIFLIPHSRKEEVQKISQSISVETGGYFDNKANAIVIFTNEQAKFNKLIVAKTIAHELAHQYGRSYNRFAVTYENDKNNTRIDGHIASGVGMSMGTIKGSFGNLFEEFYAVERELGVKEKLKEFFPELSSAQDDIITKLVAIKKITLAQSQYTAISDYSEGRITWNTSGYMMAHRLMTMILNKIPEGYELLRKARISKSWGSFSRAIDEVYGKGAFRAMSKTNPNNQEECHSLIAFLQAEGSNREKLGNDISENFKKFNEKNQKSIQNNNS